MLIAVGTFAFIAGTPALRIVGIAFTVAGTVWFLVRRRPSGITRQSLVRLLLSPVAAAGVAVWLVVMVVAYNWAVANLGHRGNLFTVVDQPTMTIFAVVVATMVTAVLAEIVVLASRRAPLGAIKVPALIVLTGIAVGLGLLILLTNGNPFVWLGPRPSCVPPDPAMNLWCDMDTPAQLAHRKGPMYFAVATILGGLVTVVLLASRIGRPPRTA